MGLFRRYLLSFVYQGRKVSYASSMGGHILDKKDDKRLPNTMPNCWRTTMRLACVS